MWRIGLVALAQLAYGCTLTFSSDEDEPRQANTCETTEDCRAGICSQGACVAREGVLETLLVEVTPPTSALWVGGGRIMNVVGELSRSRDDFELNLPRLANIRGFYRSYDTEAQASCLGGAQGTLPVKVTFTPRDRRIGLSGGGHIATTELRALSRSDLQGHPCGDRLASTEVMHELSVRVPAGDYDVYVEPALSVLGDDSECKMPPARFDGVSLSTGNVCLALAARRPDRLTVVVEHDREGTQTETLEGWQVVVIHPRSGQVLSTKDSLVAGETSDGRARVEATVEFVPVSTTASELIRLTPPPEIVAPVVQLERSGLVAVVPGEARVANLDPFPAPVRLTGWLWRASDYASGEEIPVSASLSFLATSLEGVPPGVFASFSTTATVEDDGRLSVVLLPGTYRVRVAPPVLSKLSAFETTFVVGCPRRTDDPDRCVPRDGSEAMVVQAGRVFLVPDAAVVRGTVSSVLGPSASNGATVVGLPAQMRRRRCAADAGSDCELGEPGVLDLSLGEGAFVPRAVTVLARDRRFSLDEVDCGACEPGSGALYDFYVRPPDGSGYPWALRSGVLVDQDLELDALRVPLPIIHRGMVQVPQGESPLPIGGALIRAYGLRDRAGELVADPDTPACADGVPSETRCIRSVVQVAETRAHQDGTFDLVLPSVVD
jgi:hypothetical protein